MAMQSEYQPIDILHATRLDRAFRRMMQVERSMEAGVEYDLIGVPRPDGGNDMVSQKIDKNLHRGIGDIVLDERKALKDSGHESLATEIMDSVRLEQVRRELKTIQEVPRD